MMKRLLSPADLLLLTMTFFFLCTTTSGQLPAPAQAPSAPSTPTSAQSSPPAPSPSSPSSPSSSPADIVAVLKKAGKFSTFIGLLKSTQMDSQINTELKKKTNSGGFTVFAPTDTAFSELKTGTLNSLTDEQKSALTKFHIINSFLTVPQFQTVSNPVHTSANGNTKEFPLNVIGNGTQVNITTGLVNTTVDDTVYSDGRLAVYEIPAVLLSRGILSPEAVQSPAPAPDLSTPKPKKGASTAPLNSHSPSTSSFDSSEATAGILPPFAPIMFSIAGVAVLAAFMN